MAINSAENQQIVYKKEFLMCNSTDIWLLSVKWGLKITYGIFHMFNMKKTALSFSSKAVFLLFRKVDICINFLILLYPEKSPELDSEDLLFEKYILWINDGYSSWLLFLLR